MNPTIAVVGATGAVGQEMFRVLEERKFEFKDLIPFASERSRGKKLKLRDREFECRVLEPGCFKGVDIAFFDASDAVSSRWVPEAAESGAWAVDNSGAFRNADDLPLIVPEVNGALLDQLTARAQSLSPRQRIIAGPNCTTVQLVVALKPLSDRYGLKRVVVSTYQATSGAGAAASTELKEATRMAIDGGRMQPVLFAHPIAFNCIPQIGGFKDDGFTSEEHKIMTETRKIMGLPSLKIVATSVRVPTLSGHGESVFVELQKPCNAEEAREAMRGQPGLELQDDPSKSHYPMGLNSEHQDPVFVGRIRRDPSVDAGLSFWVVSDNLRKGAALNAVQIGERLLAGLT